MKRITLAILAAAAAAFTAGGLQAQDPVPPVRPAPPAAPERPERPMPAPRPMPSPLGPDFMTSPMFETMTYDREAMRDDVRAAREAVRAIDVDQIRDQMREAASAMQFDRDAMRDLPRLPDISRAFDAPRVAPMVGSFGRDFTDRVPPAPWAQGDPADSLYRVARDALQRGEYGRAAQLFAEIPQKYPKSAYTVNAPYYEALARYRVGTTEELKTAAKVLEPLAAKSGQSTTTNGVTYEGQRKYTNESDVSALYTRINGTLAQRGDRDAAAKVEKAASQGGASTCDSEDMQVRTEALSALNQMDPGAALPFLHRVLDRKDECTAPLRRNAVLILGRRGDTASSAMIIAVAKSDPDVGVRSAAIDFLGRLPGDAGLNALDDMLRTDQDERIQRAAVRALMSSDNARARSGMRALIERKDASINLRIEAVNSYNSDHVTADDATYLRGFYAKADNDRLKDAILGALARIGGTENERWLLTVASNTSESSQLRGAAVSRLYRSQSLSVADLSKLYDSADSYNLRQQIINVLAGRKEPEATDKLVDIVKNSTDPNIRRQALYAISRKNDPRGMQALMDIIDNNKEKKP